MKRSAAYSKLALRHGSFLAERKQPRVLLSQWSCQARNSRNSRLTPKKQHRIYLYAQQQHNLWLPMFLLRVFFYFLFFKCFYLCTELGWLFSPDSTLNANCYCLLSAASYLTNRYETDIDLLITFGKMQRSIFPRIPGSWVSCRAKWKWRCWWLQLTIFTVLLQGENGHSPTYFNNITNPEVVIARKWC